MGKSVKKGSQPVKQEQKKVTTASKGENEKKLKRTKSNGSRKSITSKVSKISKSKNRPVHS